MPAYRQCRQCREQGKTAAEATIPTAEWAQHKASHRAQPVRNRGGFLKPCRRCQPPQLIAAQLWDAHLAWHREISGGLRVRPTRKLRESVLVRAGRRCQDCGKPIGVLPADWECHHVNGLPGDNRPENLRALCCGPGSCHDKRTVRSW